MPTLKRKMRSRPNENSAVMDWRINLTTLYNYVGSHIVCMLLFLIDVSFV